MFAVDVAIGTAKPSSCIPCKAVPSGVPAAKTIKACGPLARTVAICATTEISAGAKVSRSTTSILWLSGDESAWSKACSPNCPEASVVASTANRVQPFSRQKCTVAARSSCTLMLVVKTDEPRGGVVAGERHQSIGPFANSGAIAPQVAERSLPITTGERAIAVFAI